MIDSFGDEAPSYDYSNPGYNGACGHFTQQVWQATTTIGCGRSWCGGQNGVNGW